MSVLTSQQIITPDNNTDECIVFNITDAQEKFTFSDLITVGETYTIGFWAKSDNPSVLIVEDSTMNITTEWARYTHTFVATIPDLVMDFETAGTYYIYQIQLENGSISTDWTPAPEDTERDIESVKTAVSSMIIDINGIRASVDRVSESASVDVIAGLIEASVSSVRNDLDNIQKQVASIKLASDNFTVEISEISDKLENGTNKVTTTTGKFDNEGLTIEQTDSTTKTQITPDGMTVYGQNANGELSELLIAKSDGVDAYDLHAKTYLKIGGRSRFENYGDNRTGCFWIGG